MDGERQWGGFVKRSAGPGRPSKWIPQYERTLNYSIRSEAERKLVETVTKRLQAPQFYQNEAHVEIVAEVARIHTRVWQRVADLAADQELVRRLFIGVTEGDRDPYMQAILSPEQPFGDAGAGPSQPPGNEGSSPYRVEPINYRPVSPIYQNAIVEPVPMEGEELLDSDDDEESEEEEDPEEEIMEPEEEVIEPVEPDFPSPDDMGEVINPIVFRMRR